jgi:hypothetical protein
MTTAQKGFYRKTAQLKSEVGPLHKLPMHFNYEGVGEPSAPSLLCFELLLQ